MKSDYCRNNIAVSLVALRGRAWIEIICSPHFQTIATVALRGRAWIEINVSQVVGHTLCVALRGRAWIEIFDICTGL